MTKRKKQVPGAEIDWYLIYIERLKQIALVILLFLLRLGGWSYFVHHKPNPSSRWYAVCAAALLHIYSLFKPDTTTKSHLVQMQTGSTDVAPSDDQSPVRTPASQVTVTSAAQAPVGVARQKQTSAVTEKGSS